MSGFFEIVARWVIRHRYGVLVALLALSAAAAWSLTRLEYEFRASAIFDFSDEETAFSQEVKETFGTQEHLLVAVLDARDEDASVVSVEGLRALHALTEEMDALEAITSSYSLTRTPRRELTAAVLLGGAPPPLIETTPVEAADAARVAEALEASDMLEGQLVSPDHRTAIVLLEVAEPFRDAAALEGALDAIETRAGALVEEAAGQGFEVRFGGLPYVRASTMREMRSEQLLLWPAVGFFYVLALWFFLRRLRVALLPLIAVGAATLWTVGAMAALGEPMNMLNNAVPSLLLVIGVTNGVHVILRIHEAAREGAAPRDAIARGVSRVGLATLLTTLTAAVGFAALTVARASLLDHFGLVVAGGITLVFVAIIALIPALWATLQPGRAALAPPRGAWLAEALARSSRWLMRHARLTFAAALAVFIGCVTVGSQVEIDANLMESFNDDHPIAQTNALLERQMGGYLPLDVVVRAEEGTFERASSMQQLEAFQAAVRELDGVLAAISVVDLLGETGLAGDGAPDSDAPVSAGLAALTRFQPEALATFVTTPRDQARVMVRLEERGVQRNLETIEAVEALAAQHLTATADGAALEPRLTGVAYLSAHGLEAFINDLLRSLMTASIVIFLVLLVALRSLRMALLSVLPSLLPLAVTVALMLPLGFTLNTTTTIVFTITIGLAVDNTIHLLMRYREARAAGLDLEPAIEAAMRSAGPAVVTSNALLVGGFAMLLLSNFAPVSVVAALSALTIAVAMFAALILIPVQLRLFGRAGAVPSRVAEAARAASARARARATITHPSPSMTRQ